MLTRACIAPLTRYQDKMDRLMRMDPGLERRFQGKLHLPDYTCEQLASICEQVASTRFGKTFEPGLHALLGRHVGAGEDVAQALGVRRVGVDALVRLLLHRQWRVGV